MKTINKILMSANIIIGSWAFSQSLPDIINDKNTVLVDVRTAEEYAEGSTKNAINIPIDDLENRWQELRGKNNIVVFCKTGRRATKAQELLSTKGIKAYNGNTYQDVKALQKTNILELMTFSKDRPSIYILKKDNNMKQIAVGLAKGTMLAKHTTAEPALLVVLKGEIDFKINGQTIRLKELETYDIPMNIEHEVIGIQDKNLFTLTKGHW